MKNKELPDNPVTVKEWLKDNFKGKLPEFRWIALADVICHTAYGHIHGWGYEIIWEVSQHIVKIGFES